MAEDKMTPEVIEDMKRVIPLKRKEALGRKQGVGRQG
jgi:hypothetical protein